MTKENSVDRSENDIRLVVDLREFLEALARRGKAGRAPKGVTSTGLREAALVPRLGGVRVEMPGGAHFVALIEGHLDREVVFSTVPVPRLEKVLKTFTGEQQLVLEVDDTKIRFRCGGFTTEIPTSDA